MGPDSSPAADVHEGLCVLGYGWFRCAKSGPWRLPHGRKPTAACWKRGLVGRHRPSACPRSFLHDSWAASPSWQTRRSAALWRALVEQPPST